MAVICKAIACKLDGITNVRLSDFEKSVTSRCAETARIRSVLARVFHMWYCNYTILC